MDSLFLRSFLQTGNGGCRTLVVSNRHLTAPWCWGQSRGRHVFLGSSSSGGGVEWWLPFLHVRIHGWQPIMTKSVQHPSNEYPLQTCYMHPSIHACIDTYCIHWWMNAHIIHAWRACMHTCLHSIACILAHLANIPVEGLVLLTHGLDEVTTGCTMPKIFFFRRTLSLLKLNCPNMLALPTSSNHSESIRKFNGETVSVLALKLVLSAPLTDMILVLLVFLRP